MARPGTQVQDHPCWGPQGSGCGRRKQLLGLGWEMHSGKQSTSVISDMEKTLPEPVGTQVSMEEIQKESASGLDVGECENRAREMPGVGRGPDVAV